MTPTADDRCVLAIDPGREKHGVAVVRLDRVCLFRAVVLDPDLLPLVMDLQSRYQNVRLVIGSGTGHREVVRRLSECALVAEVVPERDTTRLARARFFIEHPPTGWRRWVPRGLLAPPVPVDDYAAVLIGENALSYACPPKI